MIHRLTLRSTAFVVAAAGLLFAGCLASPRVTTLVHEEPGLRVVLATVEHPAPPATHPAAIDPAVLRRVLAGLYLMKVDDPLVALVRDPVVVPAFPDEERTRLAVLLRRALSRATPDEEVLFTVTTETAGSPTVTEGSLSVRGRAVSVTLTRFRAPAGDPPLLSSPSRSFARADAWRLRFHPETALAPQAAEAAGGALPATVTVLRDRLPAATTDPVPSESVETDLRQLRETLERQEERLQRLEEMR